MQAFLCPEYLRAFCRPDTEASGCSAYCYGGARGRSKVEPVAVTFLGMAGTGFCGDLCFWGVKIDFYRLFSKNILVILYLKRY